RERMRRKGPTSFFWSFFPYLDIPSPLEGGKEKMERMHLVLVEDPVPEQRQGEYTTYRFNFEVKAESKPEAASHVTVRLNVSKSLMAMGRWSKLNETQRARCFFQFIRDRLEWGLPKQPEFELDVLYPHADKLPEFYELDEVR